MANGLGPPISTITGRPQIEEDIRRQRQLEGMGRVVRAYGEPILHPLQTLKAVDQEIGAHMRGQRSLEDTAMLGTQTGLGIVLPGAMTTKYTPNKLRIGKGEAIENMRKSWEELFDDPEYLADMIDKRHPRLKPSAKVDATKVARIISKEELEGTWIPAVKALPQEALDLVKDVLFRRDLSPDTRGQVTDGQRIIGLNPYPRTSSFKTPIHELVHVLQDHWKHPSRMGTAFTLPSNNPSVIRRQLRDVKRHLRTKLLDVMHTKTLEKKTDLKDKVAKWKEAHPNKELPEDYVKMEQEAYQLYRKSPREIDARAMATEIKKFYDKNNRGPTMNELMNMWDRHQVMLLKKFKKEAPELYKRYAKGWGEMQGYDKLVPTLTKKLKELEAGGPATSKPTQIEFSQVYGKDTPPWKRKEYFGKMTDMARSDGDAMAWARKATPKDLIELRQKMNASEALQKELKSKGDLQGYMDEASKHNLYRDQMNTYLKYRKDGPYKNVPDSLMGYAKDPLKQKGFGEHPSYKTIIKVKVKQPDGSFHIDEMDGKNVAHAMERARRNWEGATITQYSKSLKGKES